MSAGPSFPRFWQVVLDTTDARPVRVTTTNEQQPHLDLAVPTAAELDVQHARAMELGARLRIDRAQDDEEPLRVYADPAGHLFCLFVTPQARDDHA